MQNPTATVKRRLPPKTGAERQSKHQAKKPSHSIRISSAAFSALRRLRPLMDIGSSQIIERGLARLEAELRKAVPARSARGQDTLDL